MVNLLRSFDDCCQTILARNKQRSLLNAQCSIAHAEHPEKAIRMTLADDRTMSQSRA